MELNCCCFLQVFCVSNFFAQPVEPVVSQEEEEEEASHTSLQENPSNGNHYGSTNWTWSLEANKFSAVPPVFMMAMEEFKHKSELQIKTLM